MTAPISFTQSPFLYHHVPNSPYLMPTRPHIQSPVPFVPDIDNLRNGLLYNGKNNKSLLKTHHFKTRARKPYPLIFALKN